MFSFTLVEELKMSKQYGHYEVQLRAFLLGLSLALASTDCPGPREALCH